MTSTAPQIDLASLDRGMKAAADVARADPEDRAYGLDDAQADVAAHLIKYDEVHELVADVTDALAFLAWAASQEIPTHLCASFRILDRKATSLSNMIDARMESQA